MSEEMKQDGLQEEEIQAETAETAQEEAAEAAEETAEPAAEEKKELSPEDEALNVKYLRLMADFQNYKKRVEKEKSDIYTYANEKLITDFLTVIDNFERALEHECADESYAEGMKLIFGQFIGALEKAGLEEIKALGEDFDPMFHNAVMMDSNDAYESNKVTNVMQKGYMLNKKVIRPSMVMVNN